LKNRIKRFELGGEVVVRALMAFPILKPVLKDGAAFPVKSISWYC
jgi:hypothetical protein